MWILGWLHNSTVVHYMLQQHSKPNHYFQNTLNLESRHAWMLGDDASCGLESTNINTGGKTQRPLFRTGRSRCPGCDAQQMCGGELTVSTCLFAEWKSSSIARHWRKTWRASSTWPISWSTIAFLNTAWWAGGGQQQRNHQKTIQFAFFFFLQQYIGTQKHFV